MGSPIVQESETLPNPSDDDRPDVQAAQARTTRERWVERFLVAASEPTSAKSIDAQREALSMLFPEARVAGVSLVPPRRVDPDFPGSLGLVLVPDSLDVAEGQLSVAIRKILEAPDWPDYSNGLLRATLSLSPGHAPCALVVARAIDRATLTQAALEGL